MNMMTRIFLISSLILNSFLLIYLFGLIPFLLFLSVVLNVGFVYYLSFLLKERAELRNDFNSLLMKFENYTTQLLQLYELEMFYGDETLEDLLKNSKTLINDFYDYEDKYFENNEEPKEGLDLDDNPHEEENT